MMFEEDFAHTDSGLIKFNKIKIDNDAIPQAKVASLTTDLGSKAKLTVSSSTPAGPATGDLFLDTSQTREPVEVTTALSSCVLRLNLRCRPSRLQTRVASSR